MSSSIFLSHNSKDKTFVRRLYHDLANKGVKAWLDEAEIKPGDSLITKITAAINEMDYLGVVLSNNSVQSEWVQREVNMALNQEIHGKRVKVIPLLLQECKIPGFLLDKSYIDFRHDTKYAEALDRLCTFLLEEKWPSERYVGKLWKQICKRNIDTFDEYLRHDCYINLRGLADQKIENLSAYLQQQIISQTKGRFAILGDYGSGKTLLCQKLAADISKQYLSGTSEYIPLVVPLRGIHKAASIDMFIRNDIIETLYQCSIERGDFNDKLNNGQLLMIFDGLDELNIVVEQYARVEILSELLHYLSVSPVSLVTSRTHFFESEQEVNRYLSVSKEDSLLAHLRRKLFDKATYQLIFISEFDDNDISGYLQFHLGFRAKPTKAKLMSTHELMDLARRPILLRLIRETWEYLPESASIDRLMLYDTYIEIWLEREERRLLAPVKDIRQALAQLALKIVTGESDGISLYELYSFLPMMEQNRNVTPEAIGRCLATCTFLNRDAVGNFQFIHRSFAEYFAGMKIVQELEQLDFSCFARSQHVKPAPITWMPDNLVRFVAEHLRRSPRKDVVVEYLFRFVEAQATWKIPFGWAQNTWRTLYERFRQECADQEPTALFPIASNLCTFHSPCQILMSLGDIRLATRLYNAIQGGKGNCWHELYLEGEDRKAKLTIDVVERAIREGKLYHYSI